MPPAIERVDLDLVTPVGWFLDHTDLRPVSPYVATASGIWVVTDSEQTLAMTLVEDDELYRLGVTSDARRQSHATRLVDHLTTHYGRPTLVCRESLDANSFYAATGQDRLGSRVGDPEDLIEWAYTPD